MDHQGTNADTETRAAHRLQARAEAALARIAGVAPDGALAPLIEEVQAAVRELATDLKQVQGIVDSTHAQLAYMDPQFRFVQVNDSYARGACCSREELLGQDHFRLFPDKDNQAIFERVRDTGQPVRFEARPFVYPGQPERGVTYWDWSLVPVKDEAGGVQGLILSLLDVTERVRATQARERTLGHLQELLHASQQVVAEVSLDALLQRIVDAAVKLTGARAGIGRYGQRGASFEASAPSSPGTGGEVSRSHLELVRHVDSLHLTETEVGAHPAGAGLRGLLGARVVGRDGQANGLIILADKAEGEFDAEDEALLGQLASLASLALQQVEARLEVERHAATLEESNAELSVAEEELRHQNDELLLAREDLEAERRRYRELFDLAPDGYLVTDLHGVVQEANQATARLLGLAPAALVGKPLAAYVAGEDNAALYRTLTRLREEPQETAADLEARLVPRDREAFDAALTVVASASGAGGVLRWLVRDVSARRRAERERERLMTEIDGQRRFIQAVADHALVGIAVLGANDLCARWANPAYLAFLDEPYRSRGIAGLCLHEFIPQTEESGVADMFRRVAASGEPHFDAEMPHRGFARGVTYWNWSLQRLPADTAGSEPVLLLLAYEVTAQVLSRQRAEEQAASLDAIFATVSTGLMLYDADGRIVRMNAAAEARLPLTPALPVGRTPGIPLPTPDHSPRSARRPPGSEPRGEEGDESRDGAGPAGRAHLPRTCPALVPKDRVRGKGRYPREGSAEGGASVALGGLDHAPDTQTQSLAERASLLPTALGGDGRPLSADQWPLARALRGETIEGEVMGLRPGGDETAPSRWYSTSLKPVRDADGRLLGIASSFVDITELRQAQEELERRVQERTAELQAANDELRSEVAARRQAEADLRESETRFRQLARTIDEVFVLAEPAAGRVLYASPAFEALSGLPVATVYDNPGVVLDVVHPEDRKRIEAAWRKGWAGHDLEFRLVRPDGAVRWLRSRGFAVDGAAGGPSPRVASVVADITAEKDGQAALLQAERLGTAGRMAASLAHEMNNPLQAAIGCLGLLDEVLVKEGKAQQYVQVGTEALMRAAGVVAQLRALYGLPLTDASQPVDLNQLLDRVLRWTRIQREAQGIEVVCNVAPGLPQVELVPNAVEQVFLNLVLNAVEAMPHGGTLWISAAPSEDPFGVWVRLADSGTGLSTEARAHLFEPLRSTKPGNLGLGLFASRHIVEQHGGRIEFESQAGRGSTFSVFLPRLQEPALTA